MDQLLSLSLPEVLYCFQSQRPRFWKQKLREERILSRCGLEAAGDKVCKTEQCAQLQLLGCWPTICALEAELQSWSWGDFSYPLAKSLFISKRKVRSNSPFPISL